jgi:predicted anti-sigma-YlaC factor YlaD
VRCDRFREAVSARLDGEPIGLPAASLDSHLASCIDCAGWAEAAAQVTRLARLDARPVPDLSEEIAAQVTLPVRRVLRRMHFLRVGLVVVGVAQVLIAVPAFSGDSLGLSMPMHGAHETAAWNLAMGVAFLAAASVPRRSAGLIPLLATFVAVLAVLEGRDYMAGETSGERIGTHLVALAGLLLVIALDRADRALPSGGFAGGRARRDEESGDGPMRTVA